MKNDRRYTGYILAAVLAGCAAWAFLADTAATAELAASAAAQPEAVSSLLEGFLAERLPLSEELRELAMRLRLAGGMQEKEGVYVADSTLIESFEPKDSVTYLENTNVLHSVASSGDTPTYLMLIPTACAIYQERLPSSAPLYDQKSQIDEIYRLLNGRVSAVDIYPELFSARGEHLFYYSDSSLTSLGAFHCYRTVAKRLGITPHGIEDYDIVPLVRGYYGDLYDSWGFGGIKPDIISEYRSTSHSRMYQVMHYTSSGEQDKVYFELYPGCAAASGDGLDTILGGVSARVDIQTINLYSSTPRLLVLGDRTAFAMLPFLAEHYQMITFVDLGQLSDEQIRRISTSDYDQVLFAYTLESFMNTVEPSRASLLRG